MMIDVESSKKQEAVDITERVRGIVRDAGVKSGLCSVFALHSSAAVCIIESWDENIPVDFFKAINKAIPMKDDYLHDSVDGNTQSHIWASIIGPGEVVPVEDGKLALGQWQSIVFLELDGPRKRKVKVSVV